MANPSSQVGPLDQSGVLRTALERIVETNGHCEFMHEGDECPVARPTADRVKWWCSFCIAREALSTATTTEFPGAPSEAEIVAVAEWLEPWIEMDDTLAARRCARGAIRAYLSAAPQGGDELREDAWDGADGTEPCQDCGRFNGVLWNSPDPLWRELNGRYGGLLCPRCFNARAKKMGVSLTWVPMVSSRNGVRTTNWWSDPIRDRLLMGEPDPHFHDDDKAQVPQGHWGEIAQALGWPYETPYPDENRGDRMAGVIYRDSGVNAEAAAALGTTEDQSDD